MSDLPPHPQPQEWFGEHPTRGGWRALRRRGGMRGFPGARFVPVEAPNDAPAPFSWQHDRSLWLLGWEPEGWVLAELRFDPSDCRYVEIRRARYRWPREAAGTLLGRGLGAGAVEAATLAARLDAWLAGDDGAAG